jgi:uncharacterized protein YndB with AHSA1/START domain
MDKDDRRKDDLIARASVTIDAPVDEVWSALVNPRAIEQYMFGTNVSTDWAEGGAIRWTGEWQGESYEDKGVILDIQPERKLTYSHFSPLSGLADEPDNYHKVTIELEDRGERTEVTLEQDNNRSEEARQHSRENWEGVLSGLKDYVEGEDGVGDVYP